STTEGSSLSVGNIGQFSDPANTPGGYTYTIDWGDGRPVDSGTARIDHQGTGNDPTLGSFDHMHTDAETGVYTVTETITANADHRSTSGTLTVTVNNATPTLIVPGDQTAN